VQGGEATRVNTTRGPPPPCSRPAAAAVLAHAAASLSPRWNRDWNHASPPPLPPLESHWNRDWNHASPPPPPPPLYAHVDDLRVRTRPARTPTATWRATLTPTSRCCAPSGPQRATRACRSRGPQRRLESVLESGLESADVCARSAAPRVPLSRATAPTGIRTGIRAGIGGRARGYSAAPRVPLSRATAPTGIRTGIRAGIGGRARGYSAAPRVPLSRATAPTGIGARARV
jgi:hypothetical protein